MPMMDARELLAIAEAVVDDAERMFLDNLGAVPAQRKNGSDFATAADLAIEQHLRQILTMTTGIPVFGEEFGGDIDQDAVWVVDPIDGTSNYSVGNPMCAILVTLLTHGRPIVAITSLPLFGKRLSAFEGGPLLVNGAPQPAIPEQHPLVSQLGFGSIIAPEDESFSTAVRHELLSEIGNTNPRLRITGSVGVDLAFVALGIFGGAVSFSPYAWDNAAGVLLVEAAGGVVTDLSGARWTPQSHGLLAGTQSIHASLLSNIERIKPAR